VQANRLDFLLRPSRTAAAFAARTTAGALLALVLAVLLGLENPYWSAMTVVVVSQPLRGQVMAKGFYRLVGTLVGAAAGLVILYSLRPWPGALVAALALWIGACAAAANLLRGFRAYGAVLAAVTGALVALLAFEDPAKSPQLAATRISEVLLGIVVAAGVAALFLPVSDRAGLLRQARRLATDVLDWAGEVLHESVRPHPTGLEARLVADMANLIDNADQMVTDSPRFRARLPFLRGLLESMLSLMAVVRAIALHTERGSPVREALGGRLAEARARLRSPRDDAGAGLPQLRVPAELQDHIDEFDRALASLEADYRALRRPLAESPSGAWTFHRDWPTARRTGVRAVIGIALAGTLWLASGWAGGGPMLMSAAIMCAIYAAHPIPASGVRRSLLGTLLAFAAALLTRGVLLPSGAGPPLDVVVAGAFLVVGTLAMVNHRTAIAGTEFSMMFMFMTEPGRVWTHPPEHLLTLGGGIVSGVAIATVVFALVLPVDPRRRLRALTGEIVRDLERLAAAKRLPAARRWRARAYHRVLRLVVRASAADEEPETAVEGGLAAIAVGTGLLRLHSLRSDGSLPASAVDALDGALPALRSLADDPESAAAAARDAASRLGDMHTADSPGGVAVSRARLALLEVAGALGSNSRFFRAVLPRLGWAFGRRSV